MSQASFSFPYWAPSKYSRGGQDANACYLIPFEGFGGFRDRHGSAKELFLALAKAGSTASLYNHPVRSEGSSGDVPLCGSS